MKKDCDCAKGLATVAESLGAVSCGVFQSTADPREEAIFLYNMLRWRRESRPINYAGIK